VSAAREFIEGVGHATACQLGKQGRSHTALRFVWHHVLPQACGGKTEAANLASVCDNCHYSVHILMWYLANGGIPAAVKGTRAQRALADSGYQQAAAAGTAGKIPKEAAGG
jgi:hypothetical protein